MGAGLQVNPNSCQDEGLQTAPPVMYIKYPVGKNYFL